jgi:hypothetical protein
LRVWHQQIEGQDGKNVSNGSPVQWLVCFSLALSHFFRSANGDGDMNALRLCAPAALPEVETAALRGEKTGAVRWICCLMLTLLLISAAALM